MKKFLASLTVMLAISLGSSSLPAGELSIQTKGGELEVVGEINNMSLVLDGKTIFQGEGFGLSLEKHFSIGGNDVVLVMDNSGGVACPATFFFVTVSADGKTIISPSFGTCSDRAKARQQGAGIVVTMPRLLGKGKVTYVFENSRLTENGKPVE